MDDIQPTRIQHFKMGAIDFGNAVFICEPLSVGHKRVAKRCELDTFGSCNETKMVRGNLSAPMPGKVVAVSVVEGDMVTAGQVVAVVEAMKMEMPIVAPRAGRVVRVSATLGALCEAGDALVELASEAETPAAG